MGIRQTLGKGTKVGFGLGRNLQGRKMVISVHPKQDLMGWGTSPVAMRGKDKWKSEKRIG